MPAALLALLLLWAPALPSPLVGEGLGVRAQEDPLAAQTREIAARLRCAVCSNLSVADSDAELAVEMRGIIREKLAAGESPGQIEAYFVQRYGDGILLDPPRRGFSLLVWVVPPFLLFGGGLLLFLTTRRWARARTDGWREPTAAELEEYEDVVTGDLEQLRSRAR